MSTDQLSFKAASLFDQVSWPRLVLGMVLTGVLSLSVHAVMLDVLHIPYPAFKVDAPLAQFVSRGFVPVLGLVWLNALIEDRLRAVSFVARGGTLFLLAISLTGDLFRGPFMDGYCTDSYAFAYATAVPKWLAEAVLAALVVAVGRWSINRRRAVIAAIILGAVSFFLLTPAAIHASAMVQSALAALSHPGWCRLPYGWNVNVPAYLSFVEPVLSAFAMAALAWDGLPREPVRRLLAFTLLLMMISHQLLSAFVYMAYSDLPPWTGLMAMGQFSLETLALGLLTGLSWRWASRRL